MSKIVLERRETVPEGYTPIEEAGVDIRKAYRLHEKGVGVVRVDNHIYISLQDLQKFTVPEGFVTIREAAKQTGYANGTLRRFIKEGKIRNTQLYDRVYVDKRDLEGLKLQEGYLTLDEAARESDYSVDHLHHLASWADVETLVHGGRRYFSAKSLRRYIKLKKTRIGRLVTLEDAARVSNYSISHLQHLAKEKRIKGKIFKGRRYISAKSLRRYLSRPQGYLTVEEAMRESGYSRANLKKLIREEEIESVIRRRRRYVSADSLRRYQSKPEGYLTIDESAGVSNYSRYHLQWLAAREKIESTVHRGKLYISADSLTKYKEHPKAFLSVKYIAERTGYSERQLEQLVREGKIESTQYRGKRYISAESLIRHVTSRGKLKPRAASRLEFLEPLLDYLYGGGTLSKD